MSGNDSTQSSRPPLFREVNERISELAAGQHTDGAEYLCECADADCLALIRLSPGEYEAVRGAPAQFVVIPDHSVAESETIVLRTETFWVVRTTGEAGDQAEFDGSSLALTAR
jgi:hypothetical protein